MKKKAFTLIEVMIAVMIISVVIMALIKMSANNTHMLFAMNENAKNLNYGSFLIENTKYGFETEEQSLYNLLDEFNLDDDLRRKLKAVNTKIIYQELESIDMSKINPNSDIVFEFGKSVLKTKNGSIALSRIRLK